MAELEEVRPYPYYRWDCPQCGSVMDIEDYTAGEEVECEGCFDTFVLESI